jgi:predicted anti-sigma-YlaC factor YlaD
MTEQDCESVCLSAMAIAEGESPLLPPAQVEAHLAKCMNCREEVGQITDFMKIMDAQKRLEQTEDLWPAIEPSLRGQKLRSDSAFTWRHFLALGLILAGYRAIELMPGNRLGLWTNLIPALLIVAVFVYLKENPFKLNPGLVVVGE